MLAAAALLSIGPALATGPAAASRYVLITILHTNDLHGSVMPRDGVGGLARVAALVRQTRMDMPNVVLLDGGDIIHGTPEDYLSGGLATISAMNAAGYDATATGNHEYDFGLPTLAGAASAAAFPLLAANVRAAPGGQWDRVRPYVVMDVDGVRLGIIGLTTLDTISLHWPNSIKDIVVEDPFAAAKRIMPEVVAQTDVVVVLSHLGAENDLLLAAAVPGIDFIVGGHSHTAITERRWVKDILIAQTGAYARSLGRIDFIVRLGEDGGKVVSINGKVRDWSRPENAPLGKVYPAGPLIPVDGSVPEDAAVRAAYLPFRRHADDRLAEVLGELPKEGIPGRRAGQWASPAADLVADAVREFAQAEVALVDANGVGERGLPGGRVTLKDVFDLIGGYTRQHIVVARFRGRDLIAAINAGFAKRQAVNLAISGAAAEVEVIGRIPRVTAMTIGEMPLEPEREYVVAAQAYVMMDMMETAPSAVVVSEFAETTREALARYLKGRSKTAVPAGPRLRERQPTGVADG